MAVLKLTELPFIDAFMAEKHGKTIAFLPSNMFSSQKCPFSIGFSYIFL